MDSFGSVSRFSLRHVLLAGLADVVRFDKDLHPLRAQARRAGQRTSATAAPPAPLLRAVGDYETEMREYGFAAARSSLRNLRQQQRTENPLTLVGMKIALRTLNAIPPLKRRVLATA